MVISAAPQSVCTPALALDLATRAHEAQQPLLYADATGDRIVELATAAAGFLPGLTVLPFPAWDNLPYDRIPPSAAIVGRRVAALAWLAEHPGEPCLILTSARGLLGRVPPPDVWQDGAFPFASGDCFEADAVRDHLHEFGYGDDEYVDEPGHMAIRAHVLDIFPGDASAPYRLSLADGHIEAIHRIDPITQRSEPHAEARLVIRPVSEGRLDEERAAALVPLFAYLERATVLLHPEAEAHWDDLREQIADAHAAMLRLRRTGAGEGGPTYLPPPSQLYIEAADLTASLKRLGAVTDPALGRAESVAPLYRPAAVIAALAAERTVIAAGSEAGRLYEILRRRRAPVRLARDWLDACHGDTQQTAIVPVSLGSGFRRDGLTVLAVPTAQHRARTSSALTVEEPPRIGDLVVHSAHGVCRLRGLDAVDGEERVALEFAGETELLVPTDELAQIWRYGSQADAIALDRVDGEAWRKREAEIGAEIAQTARELAAQAVTSAKRKAPVIEPPASPFARFVKRFPYPLSPDQEAAIEETLADLRAGRPMDRLVCGDVGFGKTEVALRAAAACALAGYQVAVVAPTTVLAQQHFDTFTRRFARLGVRVEKLLRGATTEQGRTTRAALADGSAAIVVGTHAVVADNVRFKNLAMVVIDEEQRFGDAHKRRLSELRNQEGGVHTLVMTATPIPRTLQSAMVGLRSVSVIATPPIRRQPTRTFVLPWDPVVVREALLREHARGGQSFVVCPRIEETAPLAKQLAELVPELAITTAHGRMKPQDLEQAVTDFADGQHDVLLATNIIEAGLDIPRANTILVTRPDRFGLAQLHQMRGRVGRGARRSYAYLLTEAGKPIAPATERRLRTLEMQEQLGAGVAISLADMDARGAGDLFGEKQAGHVHAIGTELYQYMLATELATGRGEPRPAPPPVLHTEVAARLPEDLVPEPNLRLELYRRLARLPSPDAATDLADELHDRFGDLPDPVHHLLDLARLRAWCTTHRVTKLDAGPQAIALTTDRAESLAEQFGGKAKEGRVILPIAIPDPTTRLGRLLEKLVNTPLPACGRGQGERNGSP